MAMADSKHRTKATRKIILPTILLILSSSSAQAFASSTSVTSSMTSSLNASADNSHSEGDDNNNNNNNSVPQLPASSGDKDIPVLKLGESMKFEHLGPVIINVDGTTRRIDNWDEMTEHEREVTWRRISKRNQERIEALKAAAAEIDAQQSSEAN